jgi:hypothetical protein
MNPRAATEAEIAYWTEHDGGDQMPTVIGGPKEAPDVIPCPALVSTVFVPADDGSMSSYPIVHVAFQLDEVEVAHLAHGGTLWLSTWGGLPIHLVEVVPRG